MRLGYHVALRLFSPHPFEVRLRRRSSTCATIHSFEPLGTEWKNGKRVLARVE